PPLLMLDVGGVGYEIEAPMSTFYRLPDPGTALQLITHLVVREDAHILYGFASEAERALFRNLLKVSGVGARIALAVLSGITVEGFRQCVIDKDLATLMRLPGVGRKTAERLLVEMADRLPIGADGENGIAGRSTAETEAHGALLALGYRPAEAVRMLKDLDTAGRGAEDLIREALKRIHER
ncbi:MAG TPA: Holliday junction branch migration protein RuvA, partial [Gammaproteobacteria bacterium]|nr:Holliday junction branch migration protein RuvA [Gammaproteobacteria bacterium]